MQKLAIIIFFSIFLSGCTIQNLFLKKPAGLEITTTPPSRVYISGKDEGTTPFKNLNIQPGEYHIRLVPEGDSALQAWESNIELNRSVSTIIHHNFSNSEETSFGYVLLLQPDPDTSKSFLSVISDPNTVNITIDGRPYGFSPLSKQDLSPGSHTVDIGSPGYKSISLSVNTTLGYNLIINAKLAQELITIDPDPTIATSSSQSTENSQDDLLPVKPYVLISETSTGWLRVRTEPNTLAPEIGKVDSGETLPYLDSSGDGWLQVLFENQEGWISGSYATLYE